MTNFEILEDLFKAEDINKSLKLSAVTKEQRERIENFERQIELDKQKIDVNDLLRRNINLKISITKYTIFLIYHKK